jgi:hypothetical protein
MEDTAIAIQQKGKCIEAMAAVVTLLKAGQINKIEFMDAIEWQVEEYKKYTTPKEMNIDAVISLIRKVLVRSSEMKPFITMHKRKKKKVV